MREDFLGRFYLEKSASFDPLKASIPPIPGKSASLNSRLVIIIPGILPSTPSGPAELLKISPGDFFAQQNQIVGKKEQGVGL